MNTNLAFEKQPSAPTDEKVSNDLVKTNRPIHGWRQREQMRGTYT